MDFPPIPDDLGDFGDLGEVATATFSFDEFGLADETSTGTSSTTRVTKATKTNGGASSYSSRLSRGDPILVFYNLKTHAWIAHHRSVSFICFFSCYSIISMIALAVILYGFCHSCM